MRLPEGNPANVRRTAIRANRVLPVRSFNGSAGRKSDAGMQRGGKCRVPECGGSYSRKA